MTHPDPTQLDNPVLTASSHLDTFARDRLPPSDQWPQFVFDAPELHYPDFLNATAELVDRHVREGRGERPAIHGAHGCWTYRALQQQIDRIAQVLIHDMGLVSGNRLLLRGANSPMMAACCLAAIKAGLVVVPTMPLLRAVELKQVLDKAQVSAALCASSLADELAHCLDPKHPQHAPSLQQMVVFDSTAPNGLEARMQHFDSPYVGHPTTRDDVCLIAFTSGTTGKPKGTMHFHRDVLAMCDLFPRHVLNMGSAAHRRLPSPLDWAVCWRSRCAMAPAPCCWKNSHPNCCCTPSRNTA